MAVANPVSAVLIIILTVLLPPIGVFMIAGCGADLFVNICLTCLGYIPGHIHAFYLEYIYFDRRGNPVPKPHASGVYSENVQTGGRTRSGVEYGTAPVGA